MEYAKDIILDIKNGQAVERKIKPEGQLKKKRIREKNIGKNFRA